ncbi:MAG: peptidase [Hydrocarboniphaga sp.]|uniref:M16 family metallopeptidase n=1 Tax=Hydrocarboniphaga sp. TaxID=2033016 RepID=UPI0026256861|nr:M16 family metallopeptidase [Hydrocarboniphaga sp.]MDB5972068.1 peptidase [Hydrocarboniphaga sp.]
MAAAPCTRFELANGLRVLLHQDHSAPLVAVHVAYLVGAADEADGVHGMAHLYEHLMYGGSANLPGAHLTQLSAAGAHDLNGRTALDSTHYFQTVHREALEFALFAESERMAQLFTSDSAQTLELQRKVVLNELRQHRERSDGRAQELLAAMTYPIAHPYRHGIIGSEAGLNRITLDEAREFGRRYYHPGNALLALAGDIDAQQARQLCERYFGALPAGARQPRPAAPPIAAAAQRRVVAAPVPAFALHRVWNLPAPASRLVEQQHWLLTRLIETRLNASSSALAAAKPEVHYRYGRLGSQLELSFGCADVAGLRASIAQLDGEWRRLLDAGFSKTEIQSGQLSLEQNLAQRSDSRQGIAEQLIEQECFGADAAAESIEPDDLQTLTRRWLVVRAHGLQLEPETRTGTPALPARTPPAINTPTQQPELPPLEHHRLNNGLPLLIARRRGAALLAVRLIFPGGGTLETPEKMGLAQLSAALLQAAPERALSDAMTALGINLIAEAQPDCLRFAWSATQQHSLAALELLGSALQQSAASPDAFLRARDRQLAAINRDIGRAESATARVLPVLLLGPAQAWIAAGLRSSVAALTLDDLADFHRRQYRASTAVCLLVGDPPLHGSAAPSSLDFAPPAAAQSTTIRNPSCVVDIPGAAQALVTVAWNLPACDRRQQAALYLLDALLAGRFSSRLNLRLREDLGWTYGVRSRLGDGARARRYQIQVWVPPERASDTRAEILGAADTLSQRGVEPQALEQLQRSEVLRQAGSVERIDSLADVLESRLRLGLLDQAASVWFEDLAGLHADDLRACAARCLPAECAVTVIAGDAANLQKRGLHGELIAADAEALYRR